MNASGSLVAPQAASVAIDLVSEWFAHPPTPHPSSCCQTYCLHVCAVHQSMWRSWLTVVYQLRAALISPIDLNPNNVTSSESLKRAGIAPLARFLFVLLPPRQLPLHHPPPPSFFDQCRCNK